MRFLVSLCGFADRSRFGWLVLSAVYWPLGVLPALVLGSPRASRLWPRLHAWSWDAAWALDASRCRLW